MKNILRPCGVQVVARKSGTLYNKLRNNIERGSKLDTPGVYLVPLHRGLEVSAYVGRSQKSVLTRMDQHRADIRNLTDATSLAVSVGREGWIPKWNEVEILSRPRTLIRSMLGEYVEIRNRRAYLVNSVELSDRMECWRKAIGQFL